MKLRSALLCLCMLAVAVPAFAQGQLRLNLTDCTPSPRNKDLVCTSTTSTTILVASAIPATAIPNVIADLGYIDVVVGTDPASMPAFWQFQVGGCSGSARILFSADFTTNSVCADVWAGLGATGGQWGGASGPLPDGNRARIKWTTNVTPDLAFPMDAAEAYIEKVTLRQAPAASCAGCATPACAVYLSESLSLLSGTTYDITGGTGQGDFISFNDATNQATHCPAPTPNRSSTWGQVKSLYR